MDTINLSYLDDVFFDNIFLRIAVILLLLMIVHYFLKAIAGTVIRSLVRDKKYNTVASAKQREQTLIMVFTRTVDALLWIVGIGLVLGQFEFNWAGLAAGAGVLGIVVGFGAQKIAGDFFAGLFILLEGQYYVGDVVEVVGMAYGVVERIDLRTTHIRDLDGGMHIIANGEVVNMANHSYGWASALIYLWFEQDTDVDKLEKIVNKVGDKIAQDETWSKQTKTPVRFDRVEDLSKDGLKVRILGDTSPGMQWAVAGEFKRLLKPELEKAGIRIAYPHAIITSSDKK